jgi:hypothetical protein
MLDCETLAREEKLCIWRVEKMTVEKDIFMLTAVA